MNNCNEIILISIYVLGCLLSYPRLVASFYEIDEEFIYSLPPSKIIGEILASLLSWVSVLAGILVYWLHEEKYFWKFNKRDLWKKFNENK